MPAYDVIVVGLGAMGSATADELAGRGLRVLGIEAFEQGHARGSSHGPTRIVRRVIEEAPFYVPIVNDAFARWADLSADTGIELVVKCGSLRIGPVGGELVAAFRASADANRVPYEVYEPPAAAARFPAFAVPDGFELLFEPDAGFVYAARAVAILQARAERRGAELRFGEPMRGWEMSPGGHTITTAHGTYSAGRVVLTAGAWTGRLVAELGLPLQAHRVPNVSFEPPDRTLYGPDRVPPFIIAAADDGRAGGERAGSPALRDSIYGVPVVPGEGLKVGLPPTDLIDSPDRPDRPVDDAEIAAVRARLARFIPGVVDAPVASTLTCRYTKTPDEHFLIDHYPGRDDVVIASPCSGHGFKYVPAIGAILADLATGETPAFDLTPFALSRFGAA